MWMKKDVKQEEEDASPEVKPDYAAPTRDHPWLSPV